MCGVLWVWTLLEKSRTQINKIYNTCQVVLRDFSAEFPYRISLTGIILFWQKWNLPVSSNRKSQEMANFSKSPVYWQPSGHTIKITVLTFVLKSVNHVASPSLTRTAPGVTAKGSGWGRTGTCRKIRAAKKKNPKKPAASQISLRYFSDTICNQLDRSASDQTKPAGFEKKIWTVPALIKRPHLQLFDIIWIVLLIVSDLCTQDCWESGADTDPCPGEIKDPLFTQTRRSSADVFTL